MAASDVQQTLDLVLDATGISQVQVRHRPRLLSDNGPCYVSHELKDYLRQQGLEHTRGAPYHGSFRCRSSGTASAAVAHIKAGSTEERSFCPFLHAGRTFFTQHHKIII